MFVSLSADRTLMGAPEIKAPVAQSFDQLLRQADFSPPAPPKMSAESSRREQARDAAKALVASAFLVPMLASVRDTSFAAGPWAPTTAERRFGPMIDQQIADRVMHGTNFALIDSIVDRIAGVDTRA